MDDRNRLLDRVAVAAIIALFGVAFYGYMALPDTVIMGFDSNGAARYGAKLELFLLPIVACAVFIGLKISERVPSSMISLPIRITPENEPEVRTWLKQFLASLRAVMIVSFVCSEAAMVQTTLGQSNSLGIVAPVTTAAILLTVVLNLMGSRRLR